MKDLRITKKNAYCDFADSESGENIKSGESLGVILGKVKYWIGKVDELQGLCEAATEEEIDALFNE